MYERAIALLGEDAGHSSVTGPMLGLADVYSDQGRYAEAEQLLTRVLQLDEETWRPDGRQPVAASAGILNRLGRLARKRNRFERAEQLHKRALAILEDLGPDRFDVGATLIDMADLYRPQRRFAEAEPLYDRALQICVKGHMSPDHQLMRSVLANLASLYAAQDRSADVERLQRGDYLTGPSPR